MKVAPPVSPATTVTTAAAPAASASVARADSPSVAPTTTTWGSEGVAPANDSFRIGAAPVGPTVGAQRRALTGFATQAVSHAIASGQPVTVGHPLIEKFGEALGLGLGVLVTEALALVPSWNTPVLDATGKPTAHVEGADRIGHHDLLKRHQEVVGPKISALVEKLAPGVVHDLLEGLGKGATAAPGTSYRLEAGLADTFNRS